MIVVGSRCRAGLTGLLLGSMSQSLIQYSNIPVYVVPRKYVDYSAWKAERTGDMRKDADRINKQMDGTVQDIDVDPAETSVIKPIIDVVSARKPGISMPGQGSGVPDLHYRNGYAMIAFISTDNKRSERSVSSKFTMRVLRNHA